MTILPRGESFAVTSKKTRGFGILGVAANVRENGALIGKVATGTIDLLNVRDERENI